MSQARESFNNKQQEKYVQRYLMSFIHVKPFHLEDIITPNESVMAALRAGVMIYGPSDDKMLSKERSIQFCKGLTGDLDDRFPFVVKVIIPESLLPLPTCLQKGDHLIQIENIPIIYPTPYLYFYYNPRSKTKEYYEQLDNFEQLCEKGFVNPLFVNEQANLSSEKKSDKSENRSLTKKIINDGVRTLTEHVGLHKKQPKKENYSDDKPLISITGP